MATAKATRRTPATFPDAARSRVHLPTDGLDVDALEQLAATFAELARSMRGRQGPAALAPDDTVEVARILGLIGYEIDGDEPCKRD